MTVIRVDPHSVRAYGRGAQAAFDAMHASLVRLVDDLVAVRWFGPNAVACKAHSGRLAAEFAHRMHVDLAAMADAVRTSTSNIAAALGGGPIQLHIDQRPITPPAPVAVDHVDVDTAALEAMIPLVAQRFDELRGQLAAHLRLLQATDWEGAAKRTAVDAVGGFTTAAGVACDQAQHQLIGFLDQQVRAVVAADR